MIVYITEVTKWSVQGVRCIKYKTALTMLTFHIANISAWHSYSYLLLEEGNILKTV